VEKQDPIPNQTPAPESLIEKLIEAGLLARPFLKAFPSGNSPTVAKEYQKPR
jgi:hypothetical protein